MAETIDNCEVRAEIILETILYFIDLCYIYDLECIARLHGHTLKCIQTNTTQVKQMFEPVNTLYAMLIK